MLMDSIPCLFTAGIGQSIQAVWTNREPTNLQHHADRHPPCSLRSYQWPARIQYQE